MVEWRLALVAVLVTVSSDSSLIVTLGWPGRTGAELTSLTTTVKVLVAVSWGLTRSNGLLLVTMVVMRLVLGPWASVGVQVITPLALMTMLAGGLTSV